MKYKFNSLLIIAVLVVSIQGHSQVKENIEVKKSTELFDADALLERVKFLASDSLEGRRTGEKGGLIARDYLIDHFKKYEVAPMLKTYTQPFTFEGRRDKKTHNAANVLGLIEGTEFPEKYMVISAHYDHVGINRGEIYNGADDDASGTSALFALAEYLKTHPPKHSVILAAFDAEELGLKGAYHFVDQAKKENLDIVFNLNMDMISRNDNNELYIVGLNQFPQYKSLLEDISLPNNFKLLSGHDGNDGKQNWLNSSDHAAFNKAEIPFFYLGVEDHPDYHKPTDDFERIHPEFYIKAVTAVILIFEYLDDQTF